MSFNVRCVMAGLCAYVPNDASRPSKIAVIMPDARKPRTARDQQELKPHFPLLIVDARHVPGSGLPPGSQVLWALDRLELRLEASNGTPRNLNILNGAEDAFSLIPRMEEAAPRFRDIDPDCFKDAESRDLVVTRFILDRGHLGAHEFVASRVPDFSFDGILGGSGGGRKMANQTALELRSVNSLNILWRNMDGKEGEKSFELKAAPGETLTFTIGNFCDGCLPTRVEATGTIFEDPDFRWYYELCKDRQDIVLPQSGFLPIPLVSGGGGPGAIQCMPDGFAAFSF